MNRIVIVNGSFIHLLEEYILRECLQIIFPECYIENRSDPHANSPDEEIDIEPAQKHFALYNKEKMKTHNQGTKA